MNKDTNNGVSKIVEDFCKLEIHKFQSIMRNLQKSKSLQQEVSKHKVVYGGQVQQTGPQADTKSKKDNQPQTKE